jgi:hypothetical protein
MPRFTEHTILAALPVSDFRRLVREEFARMREAERLEEQGNAEGMSLARAAKLAHRRLGDVRRAAHSGALKATLEDGRWRITAGAVHAWVEAGGKLDP